MTRTPSSNAAWASGLVLGRDTGAIGLTATPPGGGALCAQPTAKSAASASSTRRVDRVGESELCSLEPVAGGYGNPPRVPILLVTAHLFDAVERHARLTLAGRQP